VSVNGTGADSQGRGSQVPLFLLSKSCLNGSVRWIEPKGFKLTSNAEARDPTPRITRHMECMLIGRARMLEESKPVIGPLIYTQGVMGD
jgi:hypothetical protein